MLLCLFVTSTVIQIVSSSRRLSLTSPFARALQSDIHTHSPLAVGSESMSLSCWTLPLWRCHGSILPFQYATRLGLAPWHCLQIWASQHINLFIAIIPFIPKYKHSALFWFPDRRFGDAFSFVKLVSRLYSLIAKYISSAIQVKSYKFHVCHSEHVEIKRHYIIGFSMTFLSICSFLNEWFLWPSLVWHLHQLTLSRTGLGLLLCVCDLDILIFWHALPELLL